jgi:hypothetical protein
MRRIIQHQETLIDYDSPQLLVAYDQFNTQYLCLLVECSEQNDKFLCVPITPIRLKDFFSACLDLREIYESPESDELFYADVVGEIKDIQLIPIARESLSDKWLPERDFYFKKDKHEDIVESRSVYQLSKEQIQDLLDLLKYKPLLEILSKQQGKSITLATSSH